MADVPAKGSNESPIRLDNVTGGCPIGGIPHRGGSAPTVHLMPPRFLGHTSTLRERITMGNREKIIEVLRRSPLTPLSYSDIKATSGVPVNACQARRRSPNDGCGASTTSAVRSAKTSAS